MSYDSFISQKMQITPPTGMSIDPSLIHPMLFDFQRDLVEWALSRGRAAIFADCGLGKTPMQLAWADYLVDATNRPALILTPLAVSYQTIREAEKFHIEAARSTDGKPKGRITVTNYEKLSHFNPDDYGAVVCDESSILKSFSGARRKEITIFMRKLPHRLLCTATAAPNDYTELGTSSEALGYLGHMDMLNRFFKNDRNNSHTGRFCGKMTEWRLKGHAEIPFWKWVCSWARALRKPSDLGYPDDDFILKPLRENVHVVTARQQDNQRLFTVHAMNLQEQRDEVRRTISERCERVAELVDHGNPALIWCHLNDEGKTLNRLIPDAEEVAGADSDESKESKLLGFANGHIRVLVTKPRIGGWGLNFQHCSHVVLFPSHSYEQYYQGIRRCWRFGQHNPVTVDIVMTEGEQRVLDNLQAKSKAADIMFTRLVELMREGQSIIPDDEFGLKEVVPAWL